MTTISFFILSKFWLIIGFTILIGIGAALVFGFIAIIVEKSDWLEKTLWWFTLITGTTFYLALVTFMFDKGIMSDAWGGLTKTYTEYKIGELEDKIKNGSGTKIYLPTKVEQFRVVSFDPPKHVYVSLKHVRTGQLYENQYVSKHCSNHPTLHELINIQVTPFYFEGRPNDVRWGFNNLSMEICS